MMRNTITLYLILLVYLTGQSQTAQDHWVDSILQQMTLDEKIGQLFVIRAHSDLGPDHIKQVEDQIDKFQVGGLCFFQGTAKKQVELTNLYQSISKRIPLFVSMDAEWGLGMRFRSGVIDYPRQLMLGAVQDNNIIYRFGREVARQMKEIGVQVNYAPVVDVNNNAKNPVINDRSFGEDKFNVATKGYMYMRGLQDEGVLACAKHFPGHGDTDTDSHHELPVIRHTMDRLAEVELFPFQTLIDHGVQGVMVAHLNVPTLDDRDRIPTSLSNRVVQDLLQTRMGFEGLVFTDGLEMQAVAKHFDDGIIEIKALEAGNDVLLLPNNLELAFTSIKKYLAVGSMTEDRINRSVRKILRAKYALELTKYQPLRTIGLRNRLNSPEGLSLKYELIENALTLVRNPQELLPIMEGVGDLASLSIGAGSLSPFQLMLSEYEKMPRYVAQHQISTSEIERLIKELQKKDLVIISLHEMHKLAQKSFGLHASGLDLIRRLNEKTKVVLVIFGNPYSLTHFDHIDHVVMAYNDDRLTQNLAAQSIFGAIGLKGRLPVTASAKSRFGTGVDTRASFRIGFSVPERMGMQMDSLREVDRIIHEIMRKRAAPGAQLLVAKDGMVVYKKEYGYHTYGKKKPVLQEHLYDLASITKVASATLAMMKLYDEGKIDLNASIAKYVPELRNTNKAGMRLIDVMAHRAGLLPWIPFYKETLSTVSHRPSSKYYQKEVSKSFNVYVADSLFLRTDYPDSIWQAIIDSDLRTRRNYRYSDLGFYIIARIVTALTGESLDDFVTREFYQPLGMRNTGYNPLKRFKKEHIVPTEKDKYFRYTLLQGQVHDMGAAMLNGVSGHAGLFSNSGDLVKLFQMLLNNGYYGGKQYLKEETIRRFTTRHPRSTRRGIGFDMKEQNGKTPCNISSMASDGTFGHYGFTGTCVWADPEHKLVYIFLSNRTYPSMKNNLLFKEDYRSKIQTAIYRSFLPSMEDSQS
ncbi:MAG: serine hydrolase [Saprospiraceae bacterium]|nr:serine hydrolase [Saprospiraceae bacterium]